jgi:hypothetical protein
MKRAIFLLAALLLAPGVGAEPLSVSKAANMRQAVDDISLAVANHDMVLVKVQPIDSALVKRGFEDPHVRILFVGSETAVRWAEAADPRLLNLLPLRLTLILKDDRLTVMSDDFAPWKREFSKPEASLLLNAWEAELKSMLEDFVRQ